MFTERIWGLEGSRDVVAVNAEDDEAPPPPPLMDVAVELLWDVEGWKPYRLLLVIDDAGWLAAVVVADDAFPLLVRSTFMALPEGW